MACDNNEANSNYKHGKVGKGKNVNAGYITNAGSQEKKAPAQLFFAGETINGFDKEEQAQVALCERIRTIGGGGGVTLATHALLVSC